MDKKEALTYELPRVVDYGDLQELTASCIGGTGGDSRVPGGVAGEFTVGTSATSLPCTGP